MIRPSDELPALINDTRSVILVMHPDRTSWRKEAAAAHRQLIRMGVDPVLYVHYQDFDASPSMRAQFISLFRERQIKQVIIFEIQSDQVTMCAADMGKKSLIDLNSTAWIHSGSNLNEVLFAFALTIKRIDSKRTNFIVPEFPEFMESLPILEATQYPSYPTQLKRLNLAVPRFQPLVMDSAIVLNEKQATLLIDYNRQIAEKNRILDSIFARYPYGFKWVDTETDEQLFSQGFQLVLKHIYATGKSAKTLLGYKIDGNETDFLSSIPIADGKRALKTIAATHPVYKFYFKQTVQKDIYTGRYWDADETWDAALVHFLTNTIRQLESQ